MSQGRKPQMTDVMVGVFIVLGAAAIIAAAMWAREGHLDRGKSVIVARFHEVGGAGVGTNAYVRGVRAGRVSGIELADDGWVHVRIAMDPSIPLPDEPVVLLGAAGLVGEWQATIVGHDAAPAEVRIREQLTAARGEPGVVPGATMTAVTQLTSGAGRILDDLGLVVGSARAAFDDSAAREVRAALANAVRITAHLAATTETIRRTAARSDSVAGSGELPRVMRDVSAAANDLRVVAGELRSFTASSGDTRLAVDRLLARMDTLISRTTTGPGTMGRAINDPSLYANADSLLMALRALVDDVKANPRRYVNLRIF